MTVLPADTDARRSGLAVLRCAALWLCDGLPWPAPGPLWHGVSAGVGGVSRGLAGRCVGHPQVTSLLMNGLAVAGSSLGEISRKGCPQGRENAV